MGIITAKNLNLWYTTNHALKDINIELPERQITALIGPSGCGKSTFLKSLNRMNDLVEGCKIEGEICLDGIDIYKDRYKNTYLVTVKLNKNVSQENQTYISAYFSEIGAKKSGVFKRQSFSRERYKLIKSI